MVVLDVVDPLVVSIEREVRGRRPKRPDFDGAVETSGSEGIGVFWVECYVHDVVSVALEDLAYRDDMSVRLAETLESGEPAREERWTHLDALPAFLPVPQLDRHVVGAGEDERLRRVDGKASDIVGVRL